MSTTVTAIILNWNQARLTLDCVASLLRQTSSIQSLIVVDNGSNPEDLATLHAGLPPTVELLQLKQNRGFAGGMNAGFRVASAVRPEYIWLVNDDAFPSPNCLAKLVAVMDRDRRLAAVTPRILTRDGGEEHAGGQYDAQSGINRTLTTTNLSMPLGKGGYWLNGPALFVRVAALNHSTLFDERFFAYWEELDLCLRMTSEGHFIQAVPDATVLHYGKASTGGQKSVMSHYLLLRNHFQIMRKYAPFARRKQLASWACERLHHAGAYSLKGQTALAQTTVEAVLAGVTGEVGRPRWLGKLPWAGRALAAHPWKLLNLCEKIGIRRPSFEPILEG